MPSFAFRSCENSSLSLVALRMGSLLALALGIAVFIVSPFNAVEHGEEQLAEFASVVCGGHNGTVVARKIEASGGLPEVVAVSWGQAEGHYALPPERLVICADGRGFLWKKSGKSFVAVSRQLERREIAQLFSSIMSFWLQGVIARGTEDGNFIWILDTDFNLIIAPAIQQREPGAPLTEIKHGDLCPGIDFCGRNSVAGPFRGVARMGGEFNLAGDRKGAEWVMHTKSGYSGSRVPLGKATSYYNEYRDANKSDAEIGRNFEKCVMRGIFLSRTPLRRTFCYLQQLGVEAILGVTRRCDITDKSVTVPGHGGLPNLSLCEEREPADGPACGVESGTSERGTPLVHLVHWIAPGQADPCQKTVAEFDAAFRDIGAKLKHMPGPTPVKSIVNTTKFLRKHSCFRDTYFTHQLHCNVHGCFGDGLTQRLHAFEVALAEGATYAEQLWDGAMYMWAQCRGSIVLEPSQGEQQHL